MERRYVEVPGGLTHELPPLLVRSVPAEISREQMVERAGEIVEMEDMLAGDDSVDLEQHKFDLALQLVGQYDRMLSHWAWGDSVLEWIRQCEITFEATGDLRALLSLNVWPHAARSSFVDLLREKQVPTGGVTLNRAVGMRLAFRQPPPIDCCSDQFLFFLNSRLAGAAYETWATMTPESTAHLPPNRFHFEVLDLRSMN
jgi:hypothetical protein